MPVMSEGELTQSFLEQWKALDRDDSLTREAFVKRFTDLCDWYKTEYMKCIEIQISEWLVGVKKLRGIEG